MKTKFENFINENHKLFIEDSMDNFDISNDKWVSEINVTDIWNNYKKNKNEKLFLKSYKDVITNKKNDIIKVNTNCWKDISTILQEDDAELVSYLNKIYDWGDKYGIKIKA